VGTSLVLLAPLAHRQLPAQDDFMGPAASAIAALAEHCGLEGSAEALVRSGVQLIDDVFADSLMVLDATWWVAMTSRERRRGISDWSPASEYVAPEHVLALGEPVGARDHALVDLWISELLGLDRRRRSSAPRGTVRIEGRRGPWPEAQLPAKKRKGMAGKAVEALWTSRRRKSVRAKGALGPAIPGRFSAVWSSAAPDRLGASEDRAE
jgi:hypothetical protein